MGQSPITFSDDDEADDKNYIRAEVTVESDPKPGVQEPLPNHIRLDTSGSGEMHTYNDFLGDRATNGQSSVQSSIVSGARDLGD